MVRDETGEKLTKMTAWRRILIVLVIAASLVSGLVAASYPGISIDSSGTISIALGGTTPTQEPTRTLSDKYMYFGHWEWYRELDAKTLKPTGFDYWRCPDGDCVGLLDFRSLPQMGVVGSAPQGYGFFVYDSPGSCTDCYYLGDSTDTILTGTQKSWIESNLGLVQSVTQSTIVDILYTDLFIRNGDPTGQDRWKPIRGSLTTGVKLYLANELVKQEEFNEDHIAFQGAVDVFQVDYARLKSEGTSTEHLRKVTGAKMQSLFGRMGDDLLEPLLGFDASDGWAIPSSTIQDTFVETGGNVNLQAHTPTPTNWGSWAAILNTITVVASADEIGNAGVAGTARAEYDFSSDDMYTQLDLISYASAESSAVCGRFASAAETYYGFLLRNNTTATYRLFKFVTGTPTQIGSTVTENPQPTAPFTIKLIIDGSSLEGFVDDVSKIAESDSSLTGQLRTGLSQVSGRRSDNFEAGDLGAAEPDIVASPTSFDFGAIGEGVTANTTNGYFTVTNNSTINIDLGIQSNGWLSGLTNWIYGSPAGVDTAYINASSANGGTGGSGGVGLFDILALNGTDTLLCDNVSTVTNPTFELELNAPTSFTHGGEQQTTTTLTATAN